MAPLALFNEGVRDHFSIYGIFVLLYFGIFVRYFLWRGGGGYIVFLAYDNGMGPTRGAGIPAPSGAIDVCISKHQSALIGGDGDSQLGRRPEDIGHRADERKPSFLAQTRKTTTSER